ncbi:resolvase [Siphonobacter sp. BAB-5385]|uniref:recombinase family protein n=1 Tax=Siphonobacter sp. BAB-5385 TaxID=1864822 RepID=UPI000B9E0D28|nr:recombinase family protein [Siphonobacter sp. BAB-5385]OZI05518.1 resolvase [Siphonobacter sp. BAB-5385]
MKTAIAYYRVSTDRQGLSGLGLEAQANAVSEFVHREGYQLITSFTEIESGKKNKRPQLQTALEQCRKEKATLVIAKLDRLGRNMAFIANLMESNVDFKAVDNPHANRLMLHLLAAFAEHEREQISRRTKEALRAAARRGVKLGVMGQARGRENAQKAREFAKQMQPIIRELREAGFITVDALRDELNRRQIPTSRPGSRWHHCSVHALLKRITK